MDTSIGGARASIKSQSTDRQTDDPLVTGVQRDDLYVSSGVSSALTAAQPCPDRCTQATPS